MNTRPAVTTRAFSIIEMLVALMITATLLVASLTALDTSFKSYKMTTESASTHVVTRIVMHRIMTMIRTGEQFGPYPADVLDPNQNPVISDAVEFVSKPDTGDGVIQVTRIEQAPDPLSTTGSDMLQITITTNDNGTITQESWPLLRDLADATFTLEYEAGPRLRRATIDIQVRPNDFQDAGIASTLEAPTIRMVSTTQPRRLD
jgi:type II secretory pathway pseudopilin PulG